MGIDFVDWCDPIGTDGIISTRGKRRTPCLIPVSYLRVPDRSLILFYSQWTLCYTSSGHVCGMVSFCQSSQSAEQSDYRGVVRHDLCRHN